MFDRYIHFLSASFETLSIKTIPALMNTTSGAGGVFFLQGFGGTGKTFLINLVLAKIRADGGIALSTASSGIAATLLEDGTTAHSSFKIPIDIHADSTCNIPAQSHLAELLCETQLVIWDESP